MAQIQHYILYNLSTKLLRTIIREGCSVWQFILARKKTNGLYAFALIPRSLGRQVIFSLLTFSHLERNWHIHSKIINFVENTPRPVFPKAAPWAVWSSGKSYLTGHHHFIPIWQQVVINMKSSTNIEMKSLNNQPVLGKAQRFERLEIDHFSK